MNTILLTGKKLTTYQYIKIVKHGIPIVISDEAISRVTQSHQFLMEKLDVNQAVYGLNRGVGGNKDQKITMDQIVEYNRNLIYSHCVSVPPEASQELVRGMMLVRLHTMLLGYTGVQIEVIQMYQTLLNHQIHPVVYERGSIGEGDITSLGFIGLTMMGEGEVIYQDQRMEAKEALKLANIQPIVMRPKAGLSMISSNALSISKGILVLFQIEQLLTLANVIYALSFESFYGQTSILHPLVQQTSHAPGLKDVIEQVRIYLKDSDLWESEEKQRLQDPLCFRSAPHVHGFVHEIIRYIRLLLTDQLNASEDNPSVFAEAKLILPTSHFEITHWVLIFELLANALSHLSKLSCMRMLKFSNPAFTQSTPFLSPNPGVIHAFGALQKTFIALDAEVRHHSFPSSNDFLSIANDMEDHSTHAPFVLSKLEKIVDNLFYILGMEAFHATQLIDLQQNRRLGRITRNVYDQVRSVVPFLDTDRVLTKDIQSLYKLFKGTIEDDFNTTINDL